MALGNTLLAVYATDEVVRTYEYVGGVFTPLGVSPVYAHNPPTPSLDVGNVEPIMQWMQSDNFLYFEYADQPSRNTIVTLDPSANQVATSPRSNTTDAGGGWGAYASDIEAVWVKLATTLHVQSEVSRLDNVGVVQSTGFTPVINGTDYHTDLSVSPSGEFITLCGRTGACRFAKRSSALGTWPPTLGAVSNVPFLFNPELVRWAGDNATVIAMSRNERVGQVYHFDGDSTWSKTHDLALIADTSAMIHKAEMSPDGRVLAVSFKNGTVYTTRLYRRQSGYMLNFQDIAAFGEDLAFSSDGVLLVDAASLKARIKDGETFINHDASMANVAADVINAKLSLAPVTKTATASVYIAALQQLATNAIDIANLKFTLLTSGAVFDEAQTDINAVTGNGAHEVTDAAWPAGGLLLENVSEQLVSPTYNFTADPVVWLTFGEAMTWRYAVLYDATSGVPLVFFDYFGDRTVGNNREVHFEFPNDVFLRLVR